MMRLSPVSRDDRILLAASQSGPASRGVMSRERGFPRRRESSTGRDAGAYDLVAAGVPARHFLDPGSESGVTNDRQDACPHHNFTTFYWLNY